MRDCSVGGCSARAGDVGVAEPGALGGQVQAVEPDQRIVNLVGFEAVRAELAPQLLRLGTRVAAPVVFVHENEHFEHAPI